MVVGGFWVTLMMGYDAAWAGVQSKMAVVLEGWGAQLMQKDVDQ